MYHIEFYQKTLLFCVVWSKRLECTIYLFRVSANIAICQFIGWNICKMITDSNSQSQEMARPGTVKVVFLSVPVNLKFGSAFQNLVNFLFKYCALSSNLFCKNGLQNRVQPGKFSFKTL